MQTRTLDLVAIQLTEALHAWRNSTGREEDVSNLAETWLAIIEQNRTAKLVKEGKY